MYQLGLTISDMCCLDASDGFFDLMHNKIKVNLITQRISQISQVYSSALADIIRQMLNLDPRQRLSAQETLAKFLDLRQSQSFHTGPPGGFAAQNMPQQFQVVPQYANSSTLQRIRSKSQCDNVSSLAPGRYPKAQLRIPNANTSLLDHSFSV